MKPTEAWQASYVPALIHLYLMLFRIETMAKSCFDIWVDTTVADCGRLAGQAIMRVNKDAEVQKLELEGVMNCTSHDFTLKHT